MLESTESTGNWKVQIFRQETPSGSRLDRAYLIKELDTCVMAHQREAPTDTTDTVVLVHPTGIPTCNP